MFKTKILLFSIILLLIPVAFGSDLNETALTEEIIYVSGDVNDTGCVNTISEAIELAESKNSTQIIIKEGNYTENNLEIKSRMDISSQGKVMINGEKKNIILSINTPDDVNISGITFTNSWGSAIEITDAKVTIDNCIFVNNTSDYGGAIYWNADNGVLKNSYFTLNRARIGSAVLWGSNDENDLKHRGKNSLIINTTFENNDNANTLVGGCIGLAVYADDVNISNCKFINNKGKFKTTGGSLLIYGDNIKVDECLFENNTMSESPAIEVYGNFAEIKNSMFLNNSIADDGHGGAIDIQSNNILVLNNTFEGNGGTECYNGGAITIYTIEDGIKNITCNRFINNTAVYGGAIFINGGAMSYVYDELIIIDGNYFYLNQANSGAGIYIMNVTIDESLVKVVNNQFKNLTAKYTTAIHISSAEVLLKNNTIEDCTSQNDINHIFNNAGYISSNLIIKVGDEDYYGLYAGKSLTINVSVFDDMGNGISGGVVYLIVNGENVADDGFSLESGVASVPFYSSVDGLYVITADYENGEIKNIKNTTVVAVPYIINIDFNQTRGLCGQNITVPVEVSVIIMGSEYIADDENLTVKFNDKQFNVSLKNGSANINLTLPDTPETYIIEITYDIKTTSKEIIVKNNTITIELEDINVTPHRGLLNVSVKDPFNETLAYANFTLKINESTINLRSDKNGKIIYNLDLDVGVYNVSITYKNQTISKKITVDYLDVILTSNDVGMIYNDATNYIVRLTDSNYIPLSNQTLNITLNGISSDYITDTNGVVSFQIKLTPDTYLINVNYKGSEIFKKTNITNRIEVKSLSKIVGSDIVMFYTDKAYYKVMFMEMTVV